MRKFLTLEKLDIEASQLMNDENADSNKVETTYFADICYIGQGYHLEVGLDLREQRPLEKLYRDFLVLHDRVYGHSVEAAVRIVNLRSVHRLRQFLQYPSFLLIKVIVLKVVDMSLLILRSNV